MKAQQQRVLSLTGGRGQQVPFQSACNGLAVAQKGASSGEENRYLPGRVP